jgi:hypothetical protein
MARTNVVATSARSRFLKLSPSRYDAVERPPGDELHGDEVNAAIVQDVVDSDDPRMIER